MWEPGRHLALAILLFAGTSGVLAQEEPPTTSANREVLDILSDPELYNRAIRPSADGAPTTVQLQMYVRDIDIDDVTMGTTFDATFRMIWTDYRLAYEAKGVQYVTVLDPTLAWLPDAFFKLAKMTQYKSVHPESYLRVFPDGRLIYSTRISLHQSCPMDLARFPHDVQTCYIRIASYGYTTEDLVFEMASSSGVTFGKQLHSNRFSIQKTMTDHCDSKTSTGDYSCMEVSMTVRREFGTYLLEWYLPTIFLVIVAWFGFLIPAGQFLARLLLTLIPLITIASFYNVYKESLASVPYIRAIDIFTAISLIVIFGTLVHIIVCQIRGSNAPEEKKSDSPEDGEGKVTSEEETSGFRRLLKQVIQKASFISRALLVGVYCFFLFVYFVAYCGTG
ncbi:glutamate-gated chloride channel-like isoform X1 [Panulirus ornatus]